MEGVALRWCWRWDFATFIVNCNIFVIWTLITIKTKLTVSDFSFSVAIHNAFIFVDSNSSNSLTIHNYTHVQMNIFVKMTDRITTQTISPSFWITLYSWVLLKWYIVCKSHHDIQEIKRYQILLMGDSGVPRNFFGGGGSTNSVECRGQRERGSGGCSPIIWRQL